MYAVAYIPLSIRAVLAPHLPIPGWRKMLDIVDAMDAQSSSILHSKKKALEKGDEEVVHQIGEGKDVMSILSTSLDPDTFSRYPLHGSESKYGSIGRR